jgi:PilZ domain
MASLPSTLASKVFAIDRRSSERVDVVIWARIRVQGQPEHPARIANISGSGFMAMSPCPIYDYAPMLVELPRIGWVKATALWSMGDRVGGEFEQLLEPEQLALLRPFHL